MLVPLLLFLLVVDATAARRGAHLIVWNRNGSTLEGELLRVEGRILHLATPDSPGVAIDIALVHKIRLVKKSNFPRMAIAPVVLGGLFTGFAKYVSYIDEGWSPVDRSDFALQIGCSSLFVAGVLSVLSGFDAVYTLEGKSEMEVDGLLAKLSARARYPYEPLVSEAAGALPEGFAESKPTRFHLSAGVGFGVTPLDHGYERALAAAGSPDPDVFAAKLDAIDPRPLAFLSHLRAEYSLNRAFRVGIQFSALRDRQEQGMMYRVLEYFPSGWKKVTACECEEVHHSRLYLATAAYAPLAVSSYKQASFKLGVGIGLGDISTLSLIANNVDSINPEEYDRSELRSLVPAFTAFAGYEYHFNSHLSLEVNLDYHLARVRVPRQEFRCRMPLYDQDTVFETTVDVPAHRVDVGGLSYGIGLALHF